MLNKFLTRISELVGKPVALYRSIGGKLIQITEVGWRITPAKYNNTDYYGRFEISTENGNEYITQFSLVEMPGCCAFCVSTEVEVSPMYRNRGINNVGNELRQYIAEYSNYTALICTDITNNEPERRTLARNGFRDIYTVVNKRTNNEVSISLKEL